jgi:hypothetical protein
MELRKHWETKENTEVQKGKGRGENESKAGQQDDEDHGKDNADA